MASQSVDSHHVGAIITQFEQENREQDAKGYTEWTNPDGELHSSESRLYQDVYNMLKNIDKYRLLKLGDNTYGLDNPKGGGIHSDDVLSSRFMDENNIRINVDESKIFVLLLLKDSFNNFMEKMGLKCAMDLRVPANLNGKALDPNVIQSDNLYVNFNGEDKELVEELNEIAERWMRCTFSADEPSEFVALFLNGMLYNRATENPIFAEWLMNATEEELPYDVRLLNKLQIEKRMGDLSITQIKELFRMVETPNIREDVLVGAYLLLDQQAAAELHFEKMDQQLQEEFQKYPIYHFWKDNGGNLK